MGLLTSVFVSSCCLCLPLPPAVSPEVYLRQVRAVCRQQFTGRVLGLKIAAAQQVLAWWSGHWHAESCLAGMVAAWRRRRSVIVAQF